MEGHSSKIKSNSRHRREGSTGAAIKEFTQPALDSHHAQTHTRSLLSDKRHWQATTSKKLESDIFQEMTIKQVLLISNMALFFFESWNSIMAGVQTG